MSSRVEQNKQKMPSDISDESSIRSIHIREKINVRNLLEKEWIPSRISLFIQLALLDKNLNGVLDFKEISEDHEIIKDLRKSMKEYLNTVSLLSALFTLSSLTVVTQNVPLGPPSTLIDDTISNENSQRLLTVYVVMASFGCVCELITTIICVIWYIKAASQTPMPEDFIWFILQHNTAVPFLILVLGVVSIIFALSCQIFLNYGLRIGAAVCVVCGIPLVAMLILLMWSHYHLISGLRKRAKRICNIYDEQMNASHNSSQMGTPGEEAPVHSLLADCIKPDVSPATEQRRNCWVGP